MHENQKSQGLPITAATKTDITHEVKDYGLLVMETEIELSYEIKKQLYWQFQAVENELGFIVDKKYEKEVSLFCEDNNLMPPNRYYLTELFIQYKNRELTTKAEKKLEIAEREIHSFIAEKNISDIKGYKDVYEYLWSIKEDLVKDKRGQKVINALSSRDKIKQQIDLQQNNFHTYEPIQSNKNKLELKFINERPTNFLLTEAPKRSSLINHINGNSFIPKGIVASLIGQGGVGKSHWCSQLAFSVTLGLDFLGHYKTTTLNGSVALIMGENSDEDIHRLLQKTTKGMNQELEKIAKDLIALPKDEAIKSILNQASKKIITHSVTGQNASFIDQNLNPTQFYKDLLQNLIDKEPESGWDLIIFDPASRFMGSDTEKDNAAATAFVALLENISQKLKGKPTVLFAHHMNKGSIGSNETSSAASRGASGLTDGVRLQINLESTDNKNQIKMKVTKSNHTAIPNDIIISKGSYGHLSFENIVLEKSQPISSNNQDEYKRPQLAKMTFRK